MKIPTECQCSKAGYCQLLGKYMHPVRWGECKNDVKYFQMFMKESQQGKYDKGISKSYGPGSILKSYLHKLGFKGGAGCKCEKHTIKMDKKGVDWCLENEDLIVGWLKAEASRRKLPFSSYVALRILRLAIRKSQNRDQVQEGLRL